MVKPGESKSISDFVSLVADDRSITLNVCENWSQLSREQVWILSEELHEFLAATAPKVEAVLK